MAYTVVLWDLMVVAHDMMSDVVEVCALVAVLGCSKDIGVADVRLLKIVQH